MIQKQVNGMKSIGLFFRFDFIINFDFYFILRYFYSQAGLLFEFCDEEIDNNELFRRT